MFPNLYIDFNFKFAGVNLAMKFPHYSQVTFGALWLEADFFVATKQISYCTTERK